MQLKKHKNSPYLKAALFTFLVVGMGFLIFSGLNSLQLTGNPVYTDRTFSKPDRV
jgi:hypothetical protein